jgi:ParB family chromosome partitioning protein
VIDPKRIASERVFEQIALDLLISRKNVRDDAAEDDDEEIARLALSLKERQLQPIVVRPVRIDGATRYEIRFGHRRYKAARVAGMASLLAEIQDDELTDGELTAIQLVENCLRKDLTPWEQAQAFRQLMLSEQLNATQLAERLNLHKSTVSRILAILEYPEDVQASIRSGALSLAVAKEVARVPALEGRRELMTAAIEQRLRAEAVARLARKMLFSKPTRGRPKRERLYKLTGFDASLTPKRFVLTVAGAKKPRTEREFLEALIQFVERLKSDVNQQMTKSPA